MMHSTSVRWDEVSQVSHVWASVSTLVRLRLHVCITARSVSDCSGQILIVFVHVLLVQEQVFLPPGDICLNQVSLWPPDAMSQYSEKHKRASRALYGEEGWHVMSRKHGGGPAWRWKQAGYVTAPKSWLNHQAFDLTVRDYLPQFLSSMQDLKLKVRYK